MKKADMGSKKNRKRGRKEKGQAAKSGAAVDGAVARPDLLDPSSRTAVLLGVLTSLFFVAFFIFPFRPHPIQSLALFGLFFVVGTSLFAQEYRSKFDQVIRWLGSIVPLSALALGVYAWFHWHALRVPISPNDPASLTWVSVPGRPIVVALLFLALGTIYGIVTTSVAKQGAALTWTAFRRLMIPAALGFSFYAFYQYFVGYERSLAGLREAFDSNLAMDPLMKQSLEHALAERRVGGALGNGNVFAAWMSVLAALSLSNLAHPRSVTLRAFAVAGYVAAAATVVLTGSRGGLLTLLFATAWALALLARGGHLSFQINPKGASTAVAFFGGAVITSIASLASAQGLISRFGKITTIQERLHYWGIAMKIWATDWFFGAGPGAFQLYYAQFKPPTARESRYAHSWIFQTGAELGVVGLALFTIFFLGLVWIAWRAWSELKPLPADLKSPEATNQSRVREISWLTLACGTLAFNGLFEYSLQTAEFLLALGILAGGAAGLHLAVPREDSPISALTVLSGVVRPLATYSLLLVVLCAAFANFLHLQIATSLEWSAESEARAGQHRHAAELYGKASDWLLDHEGFLMKRAAALSQDSAKLEEATKLLAEAQRANPLSARVRQSQARLLERQGLKQEAAVKLDEAVTLYPNDAGYRLDRANSLLELGRTGEAKADLLYIEENRLPIWGYQRAAHEELRRKVGLDAETH